MAFRRSTAPIGGSNQQIFKPRAELARFTRIFPALYALCALLGAAAFAVAFWLHVWLVAIMVAFPITGVIAGGLYAQRMAGSKIVIDGERLRIVEGNNVKANLPWHVITRLTIRPQSGENLYELWVKERAVPLPAGFYHDGDKLLMAVSARTSLAWENFS